VRPTLLCASVRCLHACVCACVCVCMWASAWMRDAPVCVRMRAGLCLRSACVFVYVCGLSVHARGSVFAFCVRVVMCVACVCVCI
jgi:hypothetical protein